MKNICFVLTNMKSGGLQRNAAILANSFSEAGHNVYICCLYSTENFYELDRKVSIIDLTTEKNKYLSFGIWKRKLFTFFKEKDIDTVISFGERCGILCSKSIGYLKIKHICRGVNTKKNFLNSFSLRCSKHIDCFIFQTNAQRSLYSKSVQNKGVVIPNPFNLIDKNLNSSTENKNRFITIASFKLKQKRQDIMVEAFAIFAKNHPNYVFEMYGETNSSTEKVKELIKKLDLSSKIKIYGEVKDVQNSVVPSRAFICSSTYEGMPNALIEALSYGIPVITTNWLGHDEIIKDGTNGLVCEMNDPHKLAEAMEKIASDDSLFKKLSSNCWNFIIHDFNKENVLNKWKQII